MLSLQNVREEATPYEPIRRCPDCGETKSLDAFPRNRASSRGRATYCKPCHANRTRACIRRIHGSGRLFQLGRRYGLDEIDIGWLLLRQNNGCAICKNETRLHVDHDHETGRVRGLLCLNCNNGLGMFDDRVELMQKAIRYLEWP